MINDCTALILAGGDSRRMGQDKAALVLDGKTLLQSITVTMQAVFPKVIVSVRQTRAGLDVQQVCDAQVDSGPLAGLAAGMEGAATPWIFAVACDMPFITPAVVELLGSYRSVPLAATSTHPSPPLSGREREKETYSSPDKGRVGGVAVSEGDCCQAVVPLVHGYPQPLAAFYATSCLGAVHDILKGNGKHSMRALLERLQVRYVSEKQMLAVDPQLRSFFDLDTPQDVAIAMNEVKK